uniref:Uncharacterized protein n=1 Tax=Globisporangium ultimum (strain ATCC 200006 / CBS 805.95 / DAOM BR144) TaxID=431595 RepID=K3X9R9_GLOUD
MGASIVLRALEDNQGLRIHVEPSNSNDPLSVTLDVFTVESFRAAEVTSPLSESDVPRYSRKCTWSKLRKLREDLQKIVQTSSNLQQHCAKCQEIVEYLEHCFERPAMLARAWHGEVILNSKVVERFMNILVAFVGSLQECAPSACADCHRHVVDCVLSFFVPTSKWD